MICFRQRLKVDIRANVATIAIHDTDESVRDMARQELEELLAES